MIDSNYISSLPEASGNLTTGAYKVTGNRSATVLSSSKPQNPSTVTLKNISTNFKIEQSSSGVLLQVFCSNNGRKARLILERNRTDVPNSDTKRVVVPICGTQIIYDNGLAIGGYKWENK